MEVIRPIPRQDLRYEVTAQIVQLLVSLEPGQKLPSERELSEELGVGRSTVREVVRSLSFMGAIRAKQGDGLYVGNVDGDVFRKLTELGIVFQKPKVYELVEARTELEIAVSKIAAERHTEEDRATLEEIMRNMARHVGDPVRASQLDLDFHVALARSSHNAVLGFLVDSMRSVLEIWLRSAFSNRQIDIPEIIDEHNAILGALFARDEAKVADLVRKHLQNASERLLRVVGEDASLVHAKGFAFTDDGPVVKEI